MTLRRVEEEPLASREFQPELLPWHDIEWQKLWLATQARPWRSLALVPSGTTMGDDLTVRIAARLARTGMTHVGVPVRAVDATRVPLGQLVEFTEELERVARFGDLVLVAVAPTTKSPVSIALAQATDVALLCTPMNAKWRDAERAIEQVGRHRFLGTMIAHLRKP
jgi:hypothetical protein